jgi:hypothetical protein
MIARGSCGLSPPLRIGPWTLAAIERTDILAETRGGGIGATGGKRPVALLIAGPDGIHGTDMAGRALDRQRMEALLPGALDRFARAAERIREEDDP